MEGHDPKHQRGTDTVEAITTNVGDDQLTDATALLILLGRLHSYLSDQASAEDMQVFCFGFHQLFSSIDLLYRVRLPDLAVRPSGSGEHLLTAEIAVRHYHLWICLRHIKRLLERIELLCQLINGAAINILDALETENTLAVSPHHARIAENDNGEVRAGETEVQEHWKRAFTVISERLDDWQRCNNKRLSFTRQFANLAPDIPGVVELDGAFDGILSTMCFLLGRILPDFRTIFVGDDEAIAALLLDLMQKSDLLLMHIDTMAEPLESLIKHFAIDIYTLISTSTK